MSYFHQNQLTKLYESLHTSSFNEVKDAWGFYSPSLLSYARSFNECLPHETTQTSYTSLINSMHASHVTLFGDFHTYAPAQISFLKVLNDYRQSYPDRKVTIALEMNRAADQKIIDQFLSKDISEEDFLAKTDYKKDWGFPWPQFKAIFTYAQEHNLKVIGINTANHETQEARQRDEFAAQRICQQLQQYSDELVYCLIGEYHLADAHLPAELRKLTQKANITRLLFNTDKYADSYHQSREATYLSLDDSTFCMLTDPAWLKWQSLGLWLQTQDKCTYSQENSQQNYEFEMEEFDLDYHFYALAKQVASFLGIKKAPESFTNFQIDLKPSLRTEGSDKRLIWDGFSFTTHDRLSFVEIQPQYLCEAVGQFLQLTDSPQPHAPTPEQSFYIRVLRYAAGVFIAKILDPNIHYADITDMRSYLKNTSQAHLQGHAKHVRHAYREAIRHQDWLERRMLSKDLKFSKPPRVIYLTDEHMDYEISKSVGQIMGLKMFHDFLAGTLAHTEISRLIYNLDDTSSESLWSRITQIFVTTPQKFSEAA